MLHRIVFLFLFSFPFFAVSQISISDGGSVDITCGEEITFTDSDADGGNYASGESISITICPDGGNAVVLRIIPEVGDVWDVDESDELTIYNGDDTSAPVLGTYDSASFPTGFVVATTIENPTGCMTFVFNSDADIQGAGWQGIIQCGVAWQPFELAITSDPADGENDPGYIDVCPGETVEFTVSGDFPYSSTDGNGYEQTDDNLEYTWSMGEGTIFEGPGLTSVDFSYDLQFGYNIVVAATDIQGLTVRDTIKVRVSTTPFFGTALPLDSIICLGSTTEVIGGYIDESEAAGFEENEGAFYVGGLSSGQFYLPDGSGEIYEGIINIVNAPDGAIIDEMSDLLMFCVNIEHSFLGDLEMALECPDGTTIAIFDGYGGEGEIVPGTGFGGGGTYLGNALDNDQFTPGEGWDYCFSMDADWGTMEDEFAAGNTTATDLGNAMSEGTYLPQDSFADLIGCPINGEWNLLVADNIGIDDGYVFEWSLILDPSLYPDPEYYQSEIIDAYWDPNPYIIATNELNIEVQPEEPGYSNYTFVVEDNFGCSWDTIVSVLTLETPIADAGPDIYVGCVDAQLLGTVNGLSVPNCSDDAGIYDYCYINDDNTTFTYCPDNPGDGITMMTITFIEGTTENFFDQITVYDGEDTSAPVIATGIEGDLAGLSWTATNPDGCITMLITSDGSVSCESGSQTEWMFEVSCDTGGDNFVVIWDPIDNLSDPNILNPTIIDPVDGAEYILTVYPAIEQDCASTDVAIVYVGDLPYAGEDNDVIICPNDAPLLMFAALQEDPDAGGIWINSAGEEVDEEFDPSTMNDDVFTYQIGPDECLSEANLTIDVNSLDIDVSNDTIICIEGSADLEVTLLNDPIGDIEYVWDNGDDTAISAVNPGSTQVFSVYIAYGDGCISETLETEVDYYSPLLVEVLTDTVICQGTPITIQSNSFGGGLAPYTFSWEDENGNVMAGDINEVSPIEDTEYCLTIADACETPTDTECFTVLMDEIINPEFSSENNTGCFPIQVNFDGVAENLGNVASVTWDFGDGETSNVLDQTSHNYNNYGLYDVSYTIYSTAGCVYADTVLDFIYAYPVPLASFGSDIGKTALPNTTFNFINYSVGNVFNTWYFDNYGVSEEEEPSFTFPNEETGNYTITLIVENEFGCLDSVQRFVIVEQEFEMYIPNTFTPNLDGVNDVFYVYSFDVDETEYVLRVFDRWGEIVWETQDLYGVWDGSHRDGQYYVIDGTYNYIINTKSASTGDRKIITGTVNVLR